MTKFIKLAVAALLMGIPRLAVAEAGGEGHDVRTFTCPIGGKTFKQDVGYSAFPLLTMPDGSWLGDTEIGVQIPVCPDNGLVLVPDLAKSEAEEGERVLYADYTTEERAKLPALIADPAYVALKDEGPYAQAWWLATQLGRPAKDRFFMLQRATWATSDPAKRKRLVGRFAIEAPSIVEAMGGSHDETHYLRLYIANALREVGRFDEASALLDDIQEKAHAAAKSDDDRAGYEPVFGAEQLRLALDQKDDGRFAAELLPSRVFDDICNNEMAVLYGPTTPATLAACKIRRDREAQRDQISEEAFAISGDATTLARDCSNDAKRKQSAALDAACGTDQTRRDRLASNALLKDGAKVAAQCDATPEAKRDGPLGYACISYNSALESAFGAQLANDDDAFSIVCPGDSVSYYSDRADVATMACSEATTVRNAKAQAKLLADPTKLDAQCKRKDDFADDTTFYEVLLYACLERKRDLEDAAIDKLATDPAAFAQACGRFAKTNNSGNDVHDLTDDQQNCRRAWRQRADGAARKTAEAKGLQCIEGGDYVPGRPHCVTRVEYDRIMAAEAAERENDAMPMDMSWLQDDSSLMKAAHVRAAEMIVRAKKDRSYPKVTE